MSKDAGSIASTIDTAVIQSETQFASTESTIMSLTLIFNVALVHHMNDHSSMKAQGLYQLAITTQSTLPLPMDSDSLLLHVAVLNNYGVWCFHNHEYASMMACFEETEYMIDETATWTSDDDTAVTIDDTVKYGILGNLRAFRNDSMDHFTK